MRRARRWAACGALAVLLGACAGTFPAPEPLARPAAPPGGASGAAGALVRWSGGPVSLARPGAPAGFALGPFRAAEAAGAGWTVEVKSSGRAEVVWSEREASLVLFQRSRAVLADPEVEGLLARLVEVSVATVELPGGEALALPGGGVLASDPDEPGGPFEVRTLDAGLVRVTNQAGGRGRVRFPGGEVVLGPLESIDLAAAFGAASEEKASSSWDLGGAPIQVFGAARAEAVPGGLHVAADGPCRVEGLGLSLRLAAGDEVTLRAGAEPGPGAGSPSP